MFSRIFVIICIVISIQNPCKATKKRYALEYYTTNCSKYSETLTRFECVFNSPTKGVYLFSTRLMLSKTMDQDFYMRFYIDAASKRKKPVKFFDIKMKACDVLQNDLGNYIIKEIMRELRKTGNYPYECPFKKNFLYSVNNITYTDKNLPVSLPFLKFTFGIELFEKVELIGKMTVTGAIVPSK